MVVLNRFDSERFFPQRRHSLANRQCTGGGCCIGHFEFERCTADRVAVPTRFVTGSGIDDQLYVTVFNGIGDVGLALRNLVDAPEGIL